MVIPKDYPFVMFEEEKGLLKKNLQNSNNHLEFGTGGSTIYTLINSDANIVSVDTNQNWLSFMKGYRIIEENIGKRLQIHFVDIGPTKNWGFPVDESHREKFPDFSAEIFAKSDASQYDTILIDGRFRVACTLMAIYHCHANRNLTIMIHDYSLRKDYEIVEDFLDITETAKTLFCFQIKKDVDLSKVLSCYEKYKFIAD